MSRQWYSRRIRPTTAASFTARLASSSGGGTGPDRALPPSTLPVRTLPSSILVPGTLPVSTAWRRTLAGQALAEHPLQRLGDLLGQPRAGPGIGQRLSPARGHVVTGRRVTRRRHDRPTVPALDLAQPPDQVHAGTLGTPVQLGHPLISGLAAGADQDLAVPPDPPLPRALPAARVGLPHATSIAGHPWLLRSSRGLAHHPAGRARDTRQLSSASTFLYSAASRAWGIGFTTFHRTTPALSMMNVPRVATPRSSSNTP
jgi:hypothetical protein